MPRSSNPAVISIREIAERLGEHPTTVYLRVQQTGHVYPGVPARKIEGYQKLFVSRALFERVVDESDQQQESPLPWDVIR